MPSEPFVSQSIYFLLKIYILINDEAAWLNCSILCKFSKNTVSSRIINYMVITACCFIIMVFSTIFTVQMLSFIQVQTPQNLIGKVIAVILTVSMCTQPLGNALYGVLFEICKGLKFAVVIFAGIISLINLLRLLHNFLNIQIVKGKLDLTAMLCYIPNRRAVLFLH